MAASAIFADAVASMDVGRVVSAFTQSKASWQERGDLEQVALLELWKCAVEFDQAHKSRSGFGTFSFNRVRGAMIDYLRSIYGRAQGPVKARLGNCPNWRKVPDWAAGNTTWGRLDPMLVGGWRRLLDDIEAHLTINEQAVIHALFWDEMTGKDAAAHLGISESGVKYLRTSALNKLRAIYDPQAVTQ